MLSSPDADLCRRDPSLPGLQTLLDPEALIARVASVGVRLPLERIVPSYLRYKPETNCLVGFASPDSPAAISFYGKVYARGSGKPKTPAGRRNVEPGRTILGHEGIELYFFPADNRLELTEVLKPDAMWIRACPELRGTNAAAFVTLAYRPERRCVSAVVVNSANTAVLKAYAPGEFGRTSARARALDASETAMFPVLLGEDKTNRSLIFSWIPGEVLQRSLENGWGAEREIGLAGAELAALHRLEVPSLEARGTEGESAHAHRTAGMIERVCPDLGEAAATMANRIARTLKKMPAGDCTLHGDFGAKQVILKGESVTFLDFDEASCGPASIDLGNFIARLEADKLRGRIRAETVAKARSALLAGYASAGTLPTEREVAFYTAIGLFRVALEPFRWHETDWPAGMLLHMDRVSALLDDAEAFPSSAPTGKVALRS